MKKNDDNKMKKSSATFEVPVVKEPTKSIEKIADNERKKQTSIQSSVSDPVARRIAQNKRYQKIASPRRVRHGSETDSNNSSEEQSLIGSSSSTTGRHKATNKSVVSRSQALSILGLKGYPMPYVIKDTAVALLAKFDPDQGGNIRKHAAVMSAQQVLIKQQNLVFRQYKEDFETAYVNYNKSVQPIINSHSKDRDLDKAAVKMIQNLGEKLHNLGSQYFSDLKDGKKNNRELSNAYHTAYNAVMNDRDLHQYLQVEERKTLIEAMRTLYVDVTQCERHLPMGFHQQQTVIEDPIAAFETKHDEYLQDILELKTKYPNYNEAFDQLYDSLENLGIAYLSGLRKGDDIEQLSSDYAKGFKEEVGKAEQAFETEPSIWQNLHPILKAICTVIFVIKWCIYAAETDVDRHRMYHPEKLSIQDSWKRWEMDCMPQLDKEALQQVRGPENK